jgi:hypothetical protein
MTNTKEGMYPIGQSIKQKLIFQYRNKNIYNAKYLFQSERKAMAMILEITELNATETNKFA